RLLLRKFTHTARPFIPATGGGAQCRTMPAGLPLAVLMLAQSAAATAPPAGPPAPAQTAAQSAAGTAAKAAERECAPQQPAPSSRDIVVCAVKPQGYRIDPDVLAAK